MTRIYVWDPLVRLFHWSLVTFFILNALVIEDESKLHNTIGYAILALVVFRVLWGIAGTRYARFSNFPPNPREAVGQIADLATGKVRHHTGHTPLGAFMIYNLLLTVLAICVTGYLMTTDAFWGIAWPEELHEALVTWAEVSVLLHITAVLIETRRTGVKLARAMVTGYKTLPESNEVKQST